MTKSHFARRSGKSVETCPITLNWFATSSTHILGPVEWKPISASLNMPRQVELRNEPHKFDLLKSIPFVLSHQWPCRINNPLHEVYVVLARNVVGDNHSTDPGLETLAKDLHKREVEVNKSKALVRMPILFLKGWLSLPFTFRKVHCPVWAKCASPDARDAYATWARFLMPMYYSGWIPCTQTTAGNVLNRKDQHRCWICNPHLISLRIGHLVHPLWYDKSPYRNHWVHRTSDRQIVKGL